MKRFFHIVAIPIRIVLNQFGDHNPNGMMYVLKENERKVKRLVKKNPFTPVELVQPLIIRANAGDDIEILFENKLPFPAGIHMEEADYDVMDSDGAEVGFNHSSLVKKGKKTTYHFKVNRPGTYPFSDLGNPSSTEKGSNGNGLFGALFVQKRGSWWTHPETGGPITSGPFADIHHPFLPSFREYAWLFHDEMETDDLTGNKPINLMTNEQSESTHAVNYRYEPLGNRKKLVDEGVVCPECDGEEVHHDSWVFGDPATPILRGYKGDPAVVRLVHSGVKETHVFHYHVHQWLKDPSNADAEIIDAQSISPQSWYDIEPLYGLGSMQGSIGDAIVHCHLYPHFEAGMWGMNRIFDTLQDGTQYYPDGTRIKALQPLPDRPKPPKPTKDKPGFPNFIPGKPGFKAPRPPLGIEGGRGLTQLEKNAAIENPRPGAVFADPCGFNPEAPIVEYRVSAIELPIIYNRQGWHDPKGRIFVLDEDLEAVLSGEKEPEPLVIHTPAGTCVRIAFTNLLPEIAGGDVFQMFTRTYEAGFHIHFMKFDGLVNDGANVGWNYDSSVLTGQTIHYEYYADVELKAWFYHDHLFAAHYQQHGVFGSGVIHPRFTTFLDSKTGEPVVEGTEITAVHPLIPDYRDLSLFVQDFTLLYNRDGKPIQPPDYPGSQDDPGVFGVNYKCEPLQFRLKGPGDPAYSFSSYVNGDPITPVFKCYKGDPLRIRLIQGAQEESHSFHVHGMRWKAERPDVETRFESQKHIGISESFTLETLATHAGDYLWTFATEEDLWNGLWGLIRAFDEPVEGLIQLTDQKQRHPVPLLLPEPDGIPPVKAAEIDRPASAEAPLRRFDITAFHVPLNYSKYGEHDPYGIVFAHKEDIDAILNGLKAPEPLILRVNAGEEVEIHLTNALTPGHFPFEDGVWPYPEVKEQAFYPPSLRISLHPQLVLADVKTSSGETAGFNFDQSAGPGETIAYRWYIDHAFGASGLWDMTDIRNHRSLGTFGILIAEPRGSEMLDPVYLTEENKASSIVLKHPFLPETREYVLVMHDGVRLEDKKGNLIIDPADGILGETEEEDLFDTYDQGSRGFNYRTERLIRRLERHEETAWLFSSKAHGDPSTPVFEAYPGDPVTIRLVNPSERRRAHTFRLHGHYWNADAMDLTSEVKSFDGPIITGHTADLKLHYGAGGWYGLSGDYLYRSGNIRWDIELGMWGILRVYKRMQKHLPPLEMKKADPK
ncbi:multicopper oxidase domain-containing protein [Jeotgalibacillus salarius]|uniref:Copper oxidase n=1 Tax=Jeotgalibacillus salarius TaxID=546023 RepID=A0A4Y8LFL4_9BACL|nr:multicopper oxidase domain-containing protein [Jeotgalibacillus salarius]TFE01618.1 copper oxidase [Jeotgalibacillus salarius]